MHLDLKTWKIYQGELYRFNGDSRVTIKEWVADIGGEDGQRGCFALSNTPMKGCLVKVSNKMVHGSLVPLDSCWDAWMTITDLNAAKAVNDVFLACSFHITKSSIFSVMQDLSSGDKKFHLISQAVFTDGVALWNATKTFVEAKLLVLATINVVHMDIRLVPEKETKAHHYVIYNILGHKEQDSSIVFNMIDYESLAMCHRSTPVSTSQEHAISTESFDGDAQSAYHFLFWQILWMAHALYVTYFFNLINEPPKAYVRIDTTTHAFITGFFAEGDQLFKDFQDWIGKSQYDRLKEPWNIVKILGGERASPEKQRKGCKAILDTLSILGEVFEAHGSV